MIHFLILFSFAKFVAYMSVIFNNANVNKLKYCKKI